MTENNGYLKIDRTGRALVLGESLKRSLSHQTGYYQLDHQDQEQVSFKRIQSIPRHSELREPIVFQGDIAGIGSPIEVISFVINAQLKGQLTLVRGEVRKSLYFDSGDLRAARSNHLDDRLSEVLYRYGALEREAIEDAESMCEAQSRPLGNYLVTKGELTQGQLYLFFKKQVEEIFFSILLWERGEFYFTMPHHESRSTPLKLSAQLLLLEGVKRADEMKRYRDLFTSEQLILETQFEADRLAESLGSVEEELLEELSAILAHLKRPHTLRELIEHFRVGEFLIYQRLYKLHESGLIQITGERALYKHKLSVDELISLFNRSFTMIDQYARRHQIASSLTEGLEVLHHFYQDITLLDGVIFNERGQLDGAALHNNLEREGRVNDIGGVGYVLSELFFVQLFIARAWLSESEYNEVRAVYDELSQLVSS